MHILTLEEAEMVEGAGLNWGAARDKAWEAMVTGLVSGGVGGLLTCGPKCAGFAGGVGGVAGGVGGFVYGLLFVD